MPRKQKRNRYKAALQSVADNSYGCERGGTFVCGNIARGALEESKAVKAVDFEMIALREREECFRLALEKIIDYRGRRAVDIAAQALDRANMLTSKTEIAEEKTDHSEEG